MRARDEGPLPAPFQVEMVDGGVTEVDRECPGLQAAEDRVAGRSHRLQADSPAIRRPLLQQTGGLGAMVLVHVDAGPRVPRRSRLWHLRSIAVGDFSLLETADTHYIT